MKKFTRYEATTSPYFTAAFASESLLLKTNAKGGVNTVIENKHQMTSYCYVITNRAGEIVKQKLERSNSDNLVSNFFDNILKDWHELKESLVT